MADNLRRQPNYTCLETIERSRRPVGGELQMRDVLRLEVALIDGKEMFAWPGSKEFQDPRTPGLVTFGTFGTGNFAELARSVFSGDGPEFSYVGQSTRGGRMLQRWDFRVSTEHGRIRLKIYDQETVIGFSGTFYADPLTLDIIQLEMTAPDVTGESGDSLVIAIDYVPTRFGQQEFSFPSDSDLHLIALGRDDENRVQFASCREFAAKSDLRFGDEVPDAPKAEPSGVREVELPAGTALPLALLDDIELTNAAAGDSVRAELTADIKWQGKVLVSKGAIARGRLTRVEHYTERVVVGLMFQDMEWPGGRAPLRLTFVRARGLPSVRSERNLVLSFGLVPAEGAVMMQPTRKRLNRGILTSWRTEP
ncbi:MAG: hypothetical protein LAP61_08835 [Acidobacteriia bacterium]|nr:hypothetical protein [Terriglobia bacterium]